jgi:hypothetical protein
MLVSSSRPALRAAALPAAIVAATLILAGAAGSGDSDRSMAIGAPLHPAIAAAEQKTSGGQWAKAIAAGALEPAHGRQATVPAVAW